MTPIFPDKTKELYQLFKDSFDVYITFEEFLGRNDLFVVALEYDSRIVAASLIRETTLKNLFIVHRIMFSFVEKSFRGRGIHQLLLNTIYDYAKLMGIKKLVCAIRETNTSSINSFKSNGFVFQKFGEPYNNNERKLQFTRIIL